ncbi:MAG: hypothetical protein ACYDBB_06165 [Armatimonadota bacterium]
MSRRIFQRVLIALVTVLGLVTIFAGVLLAAPETKKVTVKADKILSVKQKENSKIRITTFWKGEVYQEDSLFTADTIVATSEDNVHVFDCTGNPVFTDPENRITSDKVVAQSTPRMADFTGNVKMVSTPKKKDVKGDVRGQVSGEPSTTTCDKLTYDYGKKTAKATGNVVVVQKTRTVWAEQAIYDQKAELITLTGNVRMKNTGEDELKEMRDGDIVTVSLENDWIEILAKPGGKVIWDLDVKEKEDAKPEKK